MSSTVWVAVINDVEVTHARACATREAALVWVVTKIDQTYWEVLFDQLPPEERAGLHRDKSEADPERVIRAYAGAGEDPEDEPDMWGGGDYLVQILEQEIWDLPAR